MVGSFGIFFWVAHLAFWVLLILALTRKNPEEGIASGLPAYCPGVLSPAE